VRAGGGTPDGAAAAAAWLLDHGATGLVSFGLAGGLDPVLRPGQVVIPPVVLSGGRSYCADANLAARFGGFTPHAYLAGTVVAATAIAKHDLRASTGAQAIDLESGAVAAVAESRDVPFAVVRAICDPAERDLPPAALAALDPAGAIGLMRVLASVLRHPRQIPALFALARDAAAARRTLLTLCQAGTPRPPVVAGQKPRAP
jgi:adenosylhomocysteine nucleosidase